MNKKAIIISIALLILPLSAWAARTQSSWLFDSSGYIFPAQNPTNVLISGTSRYLNFGVFSGTSGYGFRDNAGTMEFKNNGGSWASFSSGGGGSNFFTNSGSNTYLNTGTNLQAPTFEATSSVASKFPYASTTAINASGLTPGRLIYSDVNGLLQTNATTTLAGHGGATGAGIGVSFANNPFPGFPIGFVNIYGLEYAGAQPSNLGILGAVYLQDAGAQTPIIHWINNNFGTYNDADFGLSGGTLALETGINTGGSPGVPIHFYADANDASSPFIVDRPTNFTANASTTFTAGIDAARVCITGTTTCLKTGAGTVTSVATGNGLTGGTITTSGTLSINSASLSTRALTTWNGTNLAATGTPQLTVGNLVSTTTASSTFVGGLDAVRVCLTGTTTCLGSGGSGTVTSVAASGGTTGMSFTGSPITTSGTLTLTGTLGIANGGTNATSYGLNTLVAYNGTSLISTGTPQLTVGNLLSTTSAQSTFNGNVVVQGSTDTFLSEKDTVFGRDIKIGVIGNTYPGMWFNQASPDTSNYGFLFAQGTGNILNAPAGNIFDFRIGNASVLTIESNKDVMVNENGFYNIHLALASSTPWGALAVNPIAGGAANSFVIGSSTATVFLVDNSGRVGIGTTSPLTLLDVNGNITDESVKNASFLSTDNNGRINAGIGSVGSATSTGSLRNQTATVSSVNTYTPTASSTYQVSVSTSVKTISAGTLTITCTYTNVDGVASTATYFPMGLTSAGLTSTGSASFSPLTITPMKNTPITVVATFTGISVSYDIDASISAIGTITI